MGKIEMELASETNAFYGDESAAIADRSLFAHNLGILLAQTREEIVGCELMMPETPHEYVLVIYRCGATRKIHTALDSYLAITRDVCESLR